MNAHGPKSIVSPDSVMLSVFITPCTKPIAIHWATSRACARATASSSACAGVCEPAASG